MKYQIKSAKSFKRDFKLMRKRALNLEKLARCINILASGEPLPPEFRDHALKGKFSNSRECHIEPDWLLIYRINGELLILELIRTGSHSDLF